MASVDIVLDKITRSYEPGDSIKGNIVVRTKGNTSHQGITVSMVGLVSLHLSARSVGLFEAFYNSVKPVTLCDYTVEIESQGKISDGVTEYPFEFTLTALDGQRILETYHGVYVNIQYVLRADITRGFLAGKNLQKELEFIVEVPDAVPTLTPEDFVISPTSLDNVKVNAKKNIPDFNIKGKLVSSQCLLDEPFRGWLILEKCDSDIRSIELQLVRVETCGCADGFAKEATEIQNIQMGEGNIPRNLKVPIHMVFPRLFTCPTLEEKTFKINFEVNLVVMFTDGRLITEKFPIKLARGPKHI